MPLDQITLWLAALAAISILLRGAPPPLAFERINCVMTSLPPVKDATKALLDALHMMAKGNSAPAADPAIGQAALKEAETGEAWLQFSKDAFAVSTDRQKAIDALTTKVTNQQLDTATTQAEWAKEDRDRYETVYRPIEDKLVAKADEYGSQAAQDEAAAKASADVQAAAGVARGSSERQAAAVGITPNSGRFAALDRATELGTALGSVDAANKARETMKDKATALEASLVGNSNAAAILASNNANSSVASGSSAVGTTSQGNANYLGSLGIMNSGYGGAMKGYASQADILQNQYNSQLQAQALANQSSAGLWSGIGSIVGLGLNFLSDENAKTDKQPVDGALDAVKEMPVERWTYKDGQGDGGTHVGPYAQDMQRTTGLGDGKTIAVQDAVGITMRAVQELAGQVDKIEQAVGIGARRAASTSQQRQRMKEAA